MSQVTDAFEDLSHSLRVLLEADDKAHRQGFLQLDRSEAVGNIEAAVARVMNAFLSPYDALGKEAGQDLIDWYQTAELATILALKNARHHNHSRKIRSMYNFYAQEAKKLGQMEMYILVDFPGQEEGAETFDVYVSWADVPDLLALPQKEKKITPSTANTIRKYLDADRFSEYARYYELDERRVFFTWFRC